MVKRQSKDLAAVLAQAILVQVVADGSDGANGDTGATGGRPGQWLDRRCQYNTNCMVYLPMGSVVVVVRAGLLGGGYYGGVTPPSYGNGTPGDLEAVLQQRK